MGNMKKILKTSSASLLVRLDHPCLGRIAVVELEPWLNNVNSTRVGLSYCRWYWPYFRATNVCRSHPTSRLQGSYTIWNIYLGVSKLEVIMLFSVQRYKVSVVSIIWSSITMGLRDYWIVGAYASLALRIHPLCLLRLTWVISFHLW